MLRQLTRTTNKKWICRLDRPLVSKDCICCSAAQNSKFDKNFSPTSKFNCKFNSQTSLRPEEWLPLSPPEDQEETNLVRKGLPSRFVLTLPIRQHITDLLRAGPRDDKYVLLEPYSVLAQLTHTQYPNEVLTVPQGRTRTDQQCQEGRRNRLITVCDDRCVSLHWGLDLVPQGQ